MNKNKQKNVMRARSVSFCFWIISSFLLATFAYAEDPHSFNQQMEQLRAAKRVAVILSQRPDSIIGNTKDRARDALVRLDACHYFVTDQSEINQLIANFKQLNIKKIAQDKSFLPYESIAIRFDFANSTQTQMLIGFPYPKESTVDGEMYINSQSTPQTFVISRMIHRDIRRWLVKHGQLGEPTSCGHPRYCEQLARYCRSEIKVDFFRSNPHQTCKTAEFYRPMPDYCESGWQPSYNVKQEE